MRGVGLSRHNRLTPPRSSAMSFLVPQTPAPPRPAPPLVTLSVVGGHARRCAAPQSNKRASILYARLEGGVPCSPLLPPPSILPYLLERHEGIRAL